MINLRMKCAVKLTSRDRYKFNIFSTNFAGVGRRFLHGEPAVVAENVQVWTFVDCESGCRRMQANKTHKKLTDAITSHRLALTIYASVHN